MRLSRDSIHAPAGRLHLSTDALAWVVSVLFALTCNAALWRELLQGRAVDAPATWLYVGAVFVVLVAIHFLLLGLVLHRRIAKPLLSLLIVATAGAVYYIQKFNIYLDPSMLRNVLRTDVKEASELFTWSMVPHFLAYAVLPLVLLTRIELVQRRWSVALARRAGWMLLALVLAAGAAMSVFQDLSAQMRNRKELRYLITPANYLYSLGRVVVADSRTASKPREPVGTDATLAPSWKAQHKPLLVLFMLGETARAANWGLSGYERQTTPELAAIDGLINFSDVTSCGTNTETSVPCLFSPWGRRNYDEDRIRGSQSLLHVLDHAGVPVFWRDNQSGCKGVCEGLPSQAIKTDKAPPLCDGERCLDEALLDGLGGAVKLPLAWPEGASASKPSPLPVVQASRFIVLHMLGNHGPAYFKRYPAEFARFKPTCDTPDLRQCSRDQIVNAYDNALGYTDHVLAQAIDFLKQQSATHDTALIYVSDHGESLGENNLFLHGVPYMIAPKEQTRVPMVMWISPELAASRHLDLGCLRSRAAQPASHDNLFHSVLGLLDVKTAVREADMDLFQPCRTTP